MHHPGFLKRAGPFPLHVVTSAVNAELLRAADATKNIEDLRPLASAEETHLTYCIGSKFAKQLAATRAAACLVHPKNADMVPEGSAAVLTETPHRAFAMALALLYPEAFRLGIAEPKGMSTNLVHPTADIGEQVVDTAIGEGTKIDNQVQIAHNVTLGRHCIIVSQSGVAGSARLGDHVIMGAHSGVAEHVSVGDGAQIAGMAHVKDDVEPRARMGRTPARPFKEWAREVTAIRRRLRPFAGCRTNAACGAPAKCEARTRVQSWTN